MIFKLSFMYWKMNLLTVPFVQPVHCTFHYVISFSLPSLFIAPYNILPYSNSALSSAATFFVRRSAVSFPCIPTSAFTQLNNTVNFYSSASLLPSLHSLLSCSVYFYSAVFSVSLWFFVSHYYLSCMFF